MNLAGNFYANQFVSAVVTAAAKIVRVAWNGRRGTGRFRAGHLDALFQSPQDAPDPADARRPLLRRHHGPHDLHGGARLRRRGQLEELDKLVVELCLAKWKNFAEGTKYDNRLTKNFFLRTFFGNNRKPLLLREQLFCC